MMIGNVKWEWTVPNVLSLIRIALVPAFVVLYWLSINDTVYLYWALGMLVLSGLSDMFDGMIARRFNQISDMGKLLDPVADKLTQVAVVLCVALRHTELWWLFVICFVKELAQAIGSLVLMREGLKVEGAHWYGKVATFVFYVTMAFIVFSDYFLTAYRSVTSVITLVLAIILSILLVIAFVGYAQVFVQAKKKLAEKAEKKEE